MYYLILVLIYNLVSRGRTHGNGLYLDNGCNRKNGCGISSYEVRFSFTGKIKGG